MKRLVNYFVQGLLLVAPVVVTIYVCYQVFLFIDGLLNIPIPGAGFLLTVGVITLIGFVASAFVTRRALAILDKLMNRLPVVRLLYSSIRDFLNAFVGEKRRFDKPVLVRISEGSDARVLGFLTQESLEQLGISTHVAVYVPQSYNVAGNLLVVPAGNVQRLNVESSAVMAFIISGGVTNPRASAKKEV